jgi:hypothetical protein
MIIGSQEVYGKLMKQSAHPTLLKFEVLASVAKEPDGMLNQDKLKRLIRLLRPDRDGTIFGVFECLCRFRLPHISVLSSY